MISDDHVSMQFCVLSCPLSHTGTCGALQVPGGSGHETFDLELVRVLQQPNHRSFVICSSTLVPTPARPVLQPQQLLSPSSAPMRTRFVRDIRQHKQAWLGREGSQHSLVHHRRCEHVALCGEVHLV